MEIHEVIAGRARRFNQYSQGEENTNQSCKTCIRKHFSFPYTCNEGWPMGDSKWVDKGSTCINWSNSRDCKVD